MNLLIIDSNRDAAKETEKLLLSAHFPISNIYTTESISSAKELMTTKEIALVISETHLPDGTGQEFALWMSQQHPRTSLIFATDARDFETAQSALNVGVRSYLTKPFTKEQLFRALEQALSIRNHSRMEFWQNIVYNECYLTPYLLRQYGITPEEKEHVTPVLFSWYVNPRYLSLLKDSFVNYSIRNVITELMLDPLHKDDLLIIGNYIMVFCTGQRSFYDNLSHIEKLCSDVLEKCIDFLGFCNISCYISKSVPLDQVFSCITEITAFEHQDICKQDQVVNIQHVPDTPLVYQRPDIEQWAQHLFSSQSSRALSAIHTYLDSLNSYAPGAQKVLRYFQTDLIQELSKILTAKNIDSYTILEHNRLDELLPSSTNSIQDMKAWLNELRFAIKQNQTPANLPHYTIVEKIKDYIAENLNSDINRNDLSALVYLHPDTLSHIFKMQTGISVSDYIQQERLKAAKMMLMTTNRKVSDIAIDIGYDNPAYFIKIFKKKTGYTPREFRKQRMAKIS